MSTVVLRYSSLGDVVLAGAVTKALGDVCFVTKAAYAPVASRLIGVGSVRVHGVDAVPRAGPLVDLQADLRSRRVTLGRGRVRRVARHDLRRRLRVALKVGAPPPRVIERYALAAGVTPAAPPWFEVAGPRDATVLIPGARWGTKRWAPDRWSALARALPGPLLVLGGPGEEALVRAVCAAAPDRATPVCESGFDATFASLGRGRVAIGGDTGLLHLCAGAGMPVVGLFGPTTAQDGFWCHRGVPVERPLPCRPCSRHGTDRCPIGDHKCMEDLTVAAVVGAVERAVGL